MRDIDTSGSTSGDGGSIYLEATGDITTQNLDSFSSSKGRDLGKGGAISIKAGGNITTENIYSHSEGDDSGDGGAISLEATGNITTQDLYSSSYSEKGNSRNGGAISVKAEGDITTQNISSYSEGKNSGDGGAISVKARGKIDTQDLSSSSSSYFEEGNSGNGGAISVEASGMIKTQDLYSSSYSEGGNSTDGGAITIETSGNIDTQNLYSYSYSEKGNSRNGGAISVKAGENIDTQNLYSSSYSEEGNSGNGGAISVEAGENINTQSLYSYSYSEAGNSQNGGSIDLNGVGDITTKLYTFSVGKNNSGNGGKVNITTNNLSDAEILTLSSHQYSGQVTIESQAQGNLQLNDSSVITGKKITTKAIIEIELPNNKEKQITFSGTFDLGNTESESGNVFFFSSGNLNLNNVIIESNTKGDQNAGKVNIYSLGDITLSNTDILSTTNAQGDAGEIIIETPQNIQLTNKSKLIASTESIGNAGLIDIEANNLILDKNTNLITETASAGDPGAITIEAKSIDIGENAKISATVLIGSTSAGNGGNITINTNQLNITGKLGIFAETESSANAGILSLSPYKNSPDLNIEFSNNGSISASTSSTGNGGNIIIKATDNISLKGKGFIATEASGTGNAGTIEIETNNLRISNGVAISASTKNKGDAGQIKIDTTDFTLKKGTSLTTESSSAGLPGDIVINTQKLTIGKNSQISATAKKGASNTEVGGYITINANQLEISGKLGIFAETAGKSPAGTLTLNPYKNDPNLSIEFKEQGFISARSTSIGSGGNINIQAPENINIKGEGSITVETRGSGNAGIISIETENLTIAEKVKISASTSESGNGGNININSSQKFQLEGRILTDTKGTGDGGSINIKTGEMNAPKSTISTKSDNVGNAGTINIAAQENITTGILTSEANNKTKKADGGRISIISERGKINATQAIQSFSNGGNAGDVILQGQTDITTNTISSHGQQQGGQISITSETGNIDTSGGNFLANYSGEGNAGDLIIKALQGNITTTGIYSYADSDGGQITIKAGNNINIKDNSNIISASEPPRDSSGSTSLPSPPPLGDGKGGDIILEAGNNINTRNASIYSGAKDGNTGRIEIRAENAIETGPIDLASGFVREQKKVNQKFTLIPKPKGEATQGVARDIILRSNNNTIDTTGGTINSRSPDGTGDIILNARENITTGKLEASALNNSKPTTGGDVKITSEQGEINATQAIKTFSKKGTAGDVNITAVGHIHTNTIRSEGMEQGGDIIISSNSENGIDVEGALQTYSEKGTAGNVNLTSPGNINISSIRSQGRNQGGDIQVKSKRGEINSTGNIDSYSEAGRGGNVEVNAPESSVTLENDHPTA